MNILTVTILIPFLSAFGLLAINGKRVKNIFKLSLLLSAICLFLSILMIFLIDIESSALQFEVKIPWIDYYNVGIHIAVDHLALTAIVFTSLIFFLCFLYLKDRITKPKETFFWLFILESLFLAFFSCFDFLLSFILWFVTLVAVYFIMALEENGGNKTFINRYFVFNFCASLIAFIGIIIFYLQSVSVTVASGNFPRTISLIAFILIFIGFASRLPLFPLHLWIRNTYSKISLSMQIILACVMPIASFYAIFRFLKGDSFQTFHPVLIVFSLISMIYGAFMAISEKEIKTSLAYLLMFTSGFCFLGLTVLNLGAFSGFVIGIFTYGSAFAALFFIADILKCDYKITSFQDEKHFSQLNPILAGFLLVGFFAIMGFPLSGGFIAVFSILIGFFSLHPVGTAFAFLAILLVSLFVLKLMHNFILKGLTAKEFIPLGARRIVILSVLATIILVMGIYPQVFIDFIYPSVKILF